MKIKHLLLASAALIAGFSSCSKSDNGGGGEPGDDTNFSMFIKFEGLTDTRANTTPVAHDTDAPMNSGLLLFSKGDGTIYKKVQISQNVVPGGATPNQLADGKLFEDIDKEATYVHLIGNHDFAQPIADYDEVSEILAEILDITDQADALRGVSNSNIYGSGPIVPVGTSGKPLPAAAAGATKECFFPATPLLARFEIASMLGGDGIASFTVDAIYMHNFYEQMKPNSQIVSGDSPWVVGPTAEQKKPEHYAVAPTGKYKSTWNELLYDENINVASDGSKTAWPYDNAAIPAVPQTVWAYNVFAEAGATPHIVIRLKDVKLTPASTVANTGAPDYLYTNSVTSTDGEAYLTITGFRGTGSNKVDITGGNIYRMSLMKFADEDLGETPYPGEELEKVWVQVEIKKWEVVNVTPEFN